MLRVMSCAMVLYFGFLIAGWVIIGPYSLKFRTLGKSSEALFSLLNGDDMFATFFTINDSNMTIKLFGTIYIYVFVSLFIYVVLSLFIAIIMDAYEIVKERHDHGVGIEHSILHEFIAASSSSLSQHNNNNTAAAPSSSDGRDYSFGRLWSMIRRVFPSGNGAHQQSTPAYQVYTNDTDDDDARTLSVIA